MLALDDGSLVFELSDLGLDARLLVHSVSVLNFEIFAGGTAAGGALNGTVVTRLEVGLGTEEGVFELSLDVVDGSFPFKTHVVSGGGGKGITASLTFLADLG